MKVWLKCFDHEILQLNKICCINEDLTRDEYVESFLQENAVLMWAAVTKGQLHKVLIDGFSFKETDVSVVLLEFGTNRPRKTPEMRMSEFNHLWLEQLPECVLPSNEDGL